MKLLELEPKLVRRPEPGRREFVSCLADAHGLRFLCPACFASGDRIAVGVHEVLIWFRGMPESVWPGPARWEWSGMGLHDLTLKPSIQLQGACKWHGWVKDGEVLTA